MKSINFIFSSITLNGEGSNCKYILPISTMTIDIDGGELTQEPIIFDVNEYGTLYIDEPYDYIILE